MRAMQSTMDKLYEMRMTAMARAYRDVEDAPGAAVHGVAVLLVGDARGGDDHAVGLAHVTPRGGEAVAQDDLGHGGAADVAGAHHDDPVGAGAATAGQHGGRRGG